MALSGAGTVGRSRNSGVEMLAAAILVYTVVAACCSSPQTAEINANSRADTLMKWVNIGLGQAAVFLVLAAYFDKEHAVPILAGGALAGGVMYVSYVHAKEAGLDSDLPGTEPPADNNSPSRAPSTNAKLPAYNKPYIRGALWRRTTPVSSSHSCRHTSSRSPTGQCRTRWACS
jgi:hypothetical protein